jgi:hypothetical protein
MRILLTRLSDERHSVEIVRQDGSRDRTELVTREALFHDFLHYAVESTMGMQGGFWGVLASGKTFDDLNDRSGEAVSEFTETLWLVEGAVGMMTGALKAPAGQAFPTITAYFDSQGQAPPEWCTEDFVAAVAEQMRRLMGEWKATPFSETMEVHWAELSRS